MGLSISPHLLSKTESGKGVYGGLVPRRSGPPFVMELLFSYRGKVLPLQVVESETITNVKLRLEEIFDLPAENMKLLYRGMLSEGTVADYNIAPNSKIIILGSKKEEIDLVLSLKKSDITFSEDLEIKDRLQDAPRHAKILAAGVPDGAIEGNSLLVLPLPSSLELTHLRNSFGNKCRIAFTSGYMRINTNAGTQSLPLKEVLNSTFEKILQDEKDTGYSIMHLETTGETCSKNIFIYYIPNQFVDAIRIILLSCFTVT
jgi:hypothetical protein